MLVKTYGGAVLGVDAYLVEIEVDMSAPFGFALVGLPDNAVRESRDRIETAIRNNGFNWPRLKLTINMAPASVRKEGAAFDLGLALGVLGASRQISSERLSRFMIMGEVSLDGTLRPIKGALPMAIQAKKEGLAGIVLPSENAAEASIVSNIDVIPVSNLREAAEFFDGKRTIEPMRQDTREIFESNHDNFGVDLSDVNGQIMPKRAMAAAAAGGHNMIMVGPPGAGKTMLAKRFRTILPPFTLQEALETTKIHSVAGKLGTNASLLTHRPFRAPHHTASSVAMVGGGGLIPQPGEISLAHNGVLFLDEFPEFERKVLEVMRQPLEDRQVTLSRARFTVDYPANFTLLASMNPCPCGFLSHPERGCTCSPMQISRYHARISGPLIDRIDLHIHVIPLRIDDIFKPPKSEPSAVVRERVIEARNRQIHRFKDIPGVFNNAMMPPPLIRSKCIIDSESRKLIADVMNQLGLSARAYDRILKVARTLADMDDNADITDEHVAEAILFRALDQPGFFGRPTQPYFR